MILEILDQNKRILNFLLLVYFILILLISVVSFAGNVSLNKQHVFMLRLDYLIHVLFFIPWMPLACLRWGNEVKRVFWILLGAGLIMALFSESVQFYIPGKSFNPIDLLANEVGVVIGGVVLLSFKKVVSRGGVERKMGEG